jgi:hypothetical protein
VLQKKSSQPVKKQIKEKKEAVSKGAAFFVYPQL